MSTGTKGIRYDDALDRLKQWGAPIVDKPGARWHDTQCPNCAAHNAADMSLRIQSRQHNAELVCRNGCDPVLILRAIGFRGVQQVDMPPPRTDGEAHSGQVRIAYRLGKAEKGRLLYVNGLGWHCWDGERFKLDDTGAAKRAVLDVMAAALAESIVDQELRNDVRKCETANGIDGVLRVASALPEFACSVDDLDADPWLFNVANGTLDLRTMELRDHDPADRITKVARAAYDENAPGDVFPRFIAQVLPDEQVRGYLQRVAGVSLLGKVAEHILPILTGTGANGKGTWYSAMLWAFGDYGGPADPELFHARDGAHPTGQMDLFGRRMVVVSESDEGRRLAEATMKRLTGGDLIKARYMHRDLITFTPSHTAFLVTNHLPKVSGDDQATWRRLRVIPFDVVIPPEERDPHLDEKLQAEADAVLAWAVAGWNAYRANGDKLAEPPQVLAATGDYQRDSDAVGRFIDEECVTTSPVLQATTKKLFDAFERWRFREGVEQLSQKAFGQALDKRGYPVTSRTSSARHRSGIDVKVQPDA